MRYRALVSFSGKISMTSGGVSEITDSALVDDLIKAGYIIPVDEPKKAEPKTEPIEAESTEPTEKPKRRTKKNGN